MLLATKPSVRSYLLCAQGCVGLYFPAYASQSIAMELNAFLATAQGPYQRTMMEEILKEAGIAFEIRSRAAMQHLLLNAPNPGVWSAEEFWVSAERLQEAKDTLCAHGIVCEVSERLLHRSIDEIVRPLLGVKGCDLDRLVRFVRINNKETVRALFEATLKEKGGPELLEDLFFKLAAEPEGSRDLRILARALKDEVRDGFWERFLPVALGSAKETQIALLAVLQELPESRQRIDALVDALRDPDGEIREAASEALFALHQQDFGYEPENPEDEREEAIEKFLRALSPRFS